MRGAISLQTIKTARFSCLSANLSIDMRQLNGVYIQRYNRRHNEPGHIFQGRFKAVVVDKENYLLELCRYVVLNPVKAGIAEKPEQWNWSSYQATAGLRPVPEYLTVDWILGIFGRKKKAASEKVWDIHSGWSATDISLERTSGAGAAGWRRLCRKVQGPSCR